MTDDEKLPGDEERVEDAPDPAGTYGNAPGRTGRPPGEGPDHPADETVQTPGP